MNISRLLTAKGHIVGIRPHTCRFGDTYRPECLDCSYSGPLVSWPRAQAIGREHTLKSVCAWKAAK